jgi:hypothetical protein
MVVYPLCRETLAYIQAEHYSHPAAQASGVYLWLIPVGLPESCQQEFWMEAPGGDVFMVMTVVLCITVFFCARAQGDYESK